MPMQPQLDLRGPVDSYLRGVQVGTDQAATAAGTLQGFQRMGMAREQHDLATAEHQRRLAEQAASDEVWRGVADYALRGLSVEDFAADHMPNSELGMRALAQGRGTRQGWGMGPGVDTGMGAGMGTQPPLAPGAGVTAGQPGPLPTPQSYFPMGQGMPQGPMAAPGLVPPAMGAPGGGMGPSADPAQQPGAAFGQQLPLMDKMAPLPLAPVPMEEHPDDARLRTALRRADARTIQSVLPHLQNEKKRRSLTATLNHMIDQGLDENVVTPHLAAIIKSYKRAGEPEMAMELLGEAYEQHGKHAQALEIAKLRAKSVMDAIGERNKGQVEVEKLRQSGRPDPLADDVIKIEYGEATRRATEAEKEYQAALTAFQRVNVDNKGRTLGTAEVSKADIERSRQEKDPDGLGNSLGDKEYERLRGRVAAWERLQDAKRERDAAVVNRGKVAEQIQQRQQAAPAASQGAPPPKDELDMLIDTLAAQGITDPAQIEAAIQSIQ